MRSTVALGILVLLIGSQQIRTGAAVPVAPEAAAAAPEIPAVKVIVNSENSLTTLPRQELARIFLKKDVRWPDGTLAEAVEQSPSSAVRQAFNDRVLGMSEAALDRYWREQSGRVSQSVEPSDVEVVAHVRTHSQAVAYVSNDIDPGPGVRVLKVVD